MGAARALRRLKRVAPHAPLAHSVEQSAYRGVGGVARVVFAGSRPGIAGETRENFPKWKEVCCLVLVRGQLLAERHEPIEPLPRRAGVDGLRGELYPFLERGG